MAARIEGEMSLEINLMSLLSSVNVGVALNVTSIPSSFGELCNVWFRDKIAIMIGYIAAVWAIWKTRNKSSFHKIRSEDSTNVILPTCHFINIWAKLQRNGLQRPSLQGLADLQRGA